MDVGGFVGPLAFILVYSSFGPRTAFLVGAGIEAMNIVLLIIMRKKLKVREIE